MEKIRPVAREYYHVYNRGVEKRSIFLDDKDRLRFIHDLYEFNDRNAAPNMRYHFGLKLNPVSVGERSNPQKRKLLVDLIGFALMPNHYHLLLRPREDDGVSLYLQKLGTGYTLYFNQRRERTGVLFQGGYRIKHIHEDRYLRHVLDYIHLNPLELFMGKENKKDASAVNVDALAQLHEYRWSSFRDYAGQWNFPSLLASSIIDDLELLKGEKYWREIQRKARRQLGAENVPDSFLFNES